MWSRSFLYLVLLSVAVLISADIEVSSNGNQRGRRTVDHHVRHRRLNQPEVIMPMQRRRRRRRKKKPSTSDGDILPREQGYVDEAHVVHVLTPEEMAELSGKGKSSSKGNGKGKKGASNITKSFNNSTKSSTKSFTNSTKSSKSFTNSTKSSKSSKSFDDDDDDDDRNTTSTKSSKSKKGKRDRGTSSPMPTLSPTMRPTGPTTSPTTSPTMQPQAPTTSPPTIQPQAPTTSPTLTPTGLPSVVPSQEPSLPDAPTAIPSVAPSPGTGFDTTVDTTNVPANLRSAFADAQELWDSIIVVDEPDVTLSDSIATMITESCPGATIPDVVDDVFICATIRDFGDGVGGVLGRAGPSFYRTGGIPFSGTMEFDLADIQLLVDDGSFPKVILHEMAHVYGLGTLWETLDITGKDVDGDPCDYRAARATAEYQALSGCTTAVPVDMSGVAGTSCLHWDETCFGGELMTGMSSGAFQLSRITIAALEDLGYGVDYGPADPYPATELDASCRCNNLQDFETFDTKGKIVFQNEEAEETQTSAAHMASHQEHEDDVPPITELKSVFQHRKRQRQLSASGLQIATEYGKKVLAENHAWRQNMTKEENEMYIGDKITIIYYQEEGEIHGVEVTADEV